MKWISVKDSLPQLGEEVVLLSHNPPGVMNKIVGYRCCKKGWVSQEVKDYFLPIFVSHWCEIPQFSEENHNELKYIEQTDLAIVFNDKRFKGWE